MSAVNAVDVGRSHATIAIATGRGDLVGALRAEMELGVDAGAARRAARNYRLAKQKVKYRSDAAGYRDNLERGRALLWVVLRATGREPPFEIAAVTAEPSEGEAFAGNATDLVEIVPMPGPVRTIIAEFVAQHHSEHRFVKRKRERADPEAMARHPPLKDRNERR